LTLGRRDKLLERSRRKRAITPPALLAIRWLQTPCQTSYDVSCPHGETLQATRDTPQ